MTLLKWLGLGLTLGIAALTLGIGAAVASDRPWVWAVILPGAALAGLLAGGGVVLLGSVMDREVQALGGYVDALAERDRNAAPTPPQSRFRLDAVARRINELLDHAQRRATDLANRRRELEVQVRVLEAERRHLEAILNAISDGVIVTDAFNEVVLANGAAARTLGFDLGAALRHPVDQAVRDPALTRLIKDTRDGGDASLRRHLEHTVGHNGQARVYDVTMACVTSPAPGSAPGSAPGNGLRENGPAPERAHGCAGVVTILHDITREKEIAEMKSDFVSNVSHELRTPLSSIRAYLEMLVDGEANDEATRQEFYNIIQGEANRLTRLIDNILNISRIESGVVKVQREYIPLVGLVHEVIEIMRPQARAKQIELVEVPSPLYFQVFADRDMILQATMNLISNAVKYSESGGKITVSMSVDEHARTVSVRVDDTGVGIPPQDLPHLFDKFYRVNNHKKMAKGTGLGLNLVKHVVETVHGGRVSVNSEVNKGSTFTFALPIAENG